jgi:hypothetical protein
VWLLAVALAAALFVFRDFGLTWDEPLFYAYGDALGYAYTPANWFSPDFDLGRSYGPSAEDHKNRGPGYLLLARFPAAGLQALGLDAPAAWHLVNLITFLIGVYLVYKMGMWLTGEVAATFGAALFASQPLLWGHAFINPKDMPFLVLFAGSVWTGVNAVDRLLDSGTGSRGRILRELLLPGIVLGLASSNRVLGPLAGAIVGLYWIARRPGWGTVAWLAAYALLGTAVMYATWPYLWEDPLHFFEVFGLMAHNPTVLQVLFQETVYRANEIPLRYLPFFLAFTLTEPVWPLFFAGLASGILSSEPRADQRIRMLVLVTWMAVPLAYVVIAGPPMYDGMRHFLFVLPPVFVLTAAGAQSVLRLLPVTWLRPALASALILPGLVGIIRLHPYEYTYFNSMIGGTGGAFRRYETDYWLTCYKESVERLADIASSPSRVFVHRESSVAAPYAAPGMTILDERGAAGEIRAGDYVLISTRTNEDLRVFRRAPEVLSVGRAGAVFCVIRRVE